MKKSKFLKKSLAMLLALMLVVAMIPLSAAAEAADPTVYVDNQLAELSGTTYSVEATKTTVDITWVKQADVDLVAVDKNGTEIALTSVNLDEKATKSGDVYTLGLRTKVEQTEDDQDVIKDYTLKITVKETVPSSDTSIKALTDKDGNLADMTNYTISGNVITINFAFGATLPTSLGADDFITTSSDATNTGVTSFTENKGTLTVTAKDGSTKKYTVELKSDAGITSFTVPEQTEETKIEGTEITIKVPYGYKTDKVVPTFKLADGVLALTTSTNGYNKDVVTSGKTEVDFDTDTLYAWTGKEAGDYVALTVTLDVPSENPEGVLKTVKVGGSNEVTVSGNTVSVEMPAGFKFDSDAAKAVEVKGTVSENAYVAISAQGKEVAEATDGNYTMSDVNVSGKTFVITVKSEDGKTTNNYTVNLTVAASAEAKLNDFSVKYTKDGKETVYSASNGTLTLPYAAKAELDQYIVYVQASTGAKVTFGDSNTEIKNDKATNLETTDLIEDNKITLKVTGSDDTVQTYTITVKYENAKTGKALSSAGFVGTDKEAEITEDNTYASVKGTAKLNGKSVTTIKVTLPNSFEEATASVYLNALALSDGATAYLADTDAEEIVLVGNEDGTAATGISFNGKLDAVDNSGNLTEAKAIPVYVLSEKTVIDQKAAGEDIDADYVKDNGAVYYVYGVEAEPATGKSLISIASTLDENVKASLSGKQVTVTVPSSYNDNGTEFSLNFKLSKLASLYANDTDDAALKSDNGSEDTENPTKFKVEGKALKIGEDAVTSLIVKSESGETETYTVKVVVNDAETGASLTSVKVNNTSASISGKNVNVTLPFGTNLYPVKLTLTASKMATIYVGDDEYDANETYDLNTNITIKVTSEDKKTTNVYTLKATLADQFSDIDEGDWYYANVMRAVDLGILSGYSDGTFKPNNNITRRDFAIMLAQALGHNNDEPAESPFKDVADNDYGVSSIAYLYEQGITAGDDKGNFNPDSYITRQEAAIFLARAFDATGTSSETFTDDAKIASWAKEYVYACKASGLMNGDTNGTFRPTSTLTRAEAASAMVNAVDN
ncbi:s-layer domain-containing protein [Clostridium sp. CAG:1013]|nr:s-layer domain-containing protein [Clostridium sp. CAG:1013]